MCSYFFKNKLSLNMFHIVMVKLQKTCYVYVCLCMVVCVLIESVLLCTEIPKSVFESHPILRSINFFTQPYLPIFSELWFILPL
jgi:hypothetical protein